MASAAPKVDIMNKAQLAYMAWLQKTHPALYSKFVPDNSGLSGIMDSITSGFNSLLQNAGAVFTTYATTKASLDLLKVNTARAKAGQSPVQSLAEITAQNAITAGAPQSFFASIPPMAWIAGGGLLLFFLLRKK